MSKYIIDTGNYLFTTDGVLVVGFDCDNKPDTCYEPLSDLEELNSDYINEHFGELQDEAYKRGLEDAWAAAKKIFGYEIDGGIPINKVREVFGYAENAIFCTADIIRDYTAQEAIDKIKAYDGKHSDRIEVGDEVISDTGTKFTVTAFANSDNVCGISERGLWCFNAIDKLTKTGKHYDIASILEAMRT